MTRTLAIAGTTLEMLERGQGRPLLFLHPGEGLSPERPWLELLSRRFRVIAPWHPGYGIHQSKPNMTLGNDQRKLWRRLGRNRARC
jgi:pimeloyl-ACP methyl ester carboxylesterase